MNIRNKDIVIRFGSMCIVKETAQGSYNRFHVVKSNESGYYDLISTGTLSECAIILGL
mgnify:FL=1